jgi:hypothetical protein
LRPKTPHRADGPDSTPGFGPLAVLREATKAVPAVKYALGVAGVVATVAIVRAFGIDYRVAVIGCIITFVMMVLLVVFAKLSTMARREFEWPVLVLMWSSLVLTVLGAFLLLCSVFFSWPADLRGWIAPHPQVSGVAQPDPRAIVEGNRLLSAASVQLGAHDYAGAWRSLQEAGQLKPPPPGLNRCVEDAAMTWLRNMSVPEPHTFTEFVDPLVAALASSVTDERGQLEADIQAHLGWAYFLKGRDDFSLQDRAEPFYRTAVQHDAQNPFAHAMWGHLMLWNRKPLPGALEHFNAALASGRERRFVREFQIAGLGMVLSSNDDAAVEMLRVFDQMRKLGEPPPEWQRSSIVHELYDRPAGRMSTGRMQHVLSPQDHLATFLWLNDGGEFDSIDQYWRARLTESTGDLHRALAYYCEILATSAYQETIEESIARCSQALAAAGKTDELQPLEAALSELKAADAQAKHLETVQESISVLQRKKDGER